MNKLLENRVTFGATVLAFVLATALTAILGVVGPQQWQNATLQAEGPNMPPFPWCPTCDPPRSAETLRAEGPNMPPFPWCPTCDPPRSVETLRAEGPNMPPFPWCPTCDPPFTGDSNPIAASIG